MCDKTASKTKRHDVGLTLKNWAFRGRAEARKRSIFGCPIDMKLKKLEVFSRREYEEWAISKF